MVFRVIICCILCLSFLSCQNKDKGAQANKDYVMYEPSEMALLMEEMYKVNERIKQDILDGKTPEKFPEEFLNIHTAELSDFKKRNVTFESFSRLYIDKQQELFDSSTNQEARERFNQAINLCISCHQTECTGPIPRIKKLLIK